METLTILPLQSREIALKITLVCRELKPGRDAHSQSLVVACSGLTPTSCFRKFHFCYKRYWHTCGGVTVSHAHRWYWKPSFIDIFGWGGEVYPLIHSKYSSGWIFGLWNGYHRQGKSKVVPMLSFSLTEQHAMKAYWGSGGIAPRILLPRH
jgi:hypothetical protein